MRKTGYYWVNVYGEWRIAYYLNTIEHDGELNDNKHGWHFNNMHCIDADFDEIDEVRLTRPDGK